MSTKILMDMNRKYKFEKIEEVKNLMRPKVDWEKVVFYAIGIASISYLLAHFIIYLLKI